MIPSTGVKDATAASGSKPRRNTKKDRSLPAKSDKKKVKDHFRNNKSSVKQKNRVDSSISYKRTIINSNSNKCLTSFNHDKCVVKSLKFVKKPHVHKPTRRKFTLGERCPLTRFTESKVVLVKQPKSVSTGDIVITERLSNTSQKPLTRNFKKFIRTVRFRNDHFGAIMGYEDYVIGDRVISRPDLKFLRIYGTLCYPTDDSEDLGKLRPTTDIGIFIGYTPNMKDYRIYNKRTRRIMEIIHVQFDELTEPISLMHISTGPEPILLTPGQISSGLVPDPCVKRSAPPAPAVHVLVVSAGVVAGPTIEDNPFAQADNDPFVNMFAPEPSSDESSSGDLEKASPVLHDTVTSHLMTASQPFMTASARTA
nr:hypothetical protein [Tanacetum cinerariifolium]